MAAPGPNGTMQDRRTPLPVRGAVAQGAGKRAVDSLLVNPAVYGSTGKESLQLAGDRRRQFRSQEIKHHEHRLLGVLLGDPCSLYNQVYYLFVHGELSARAR